MMGDYLKLFIFIMVMIASILSVFTVSYIDSQSHESAHKEIYRKYGLNSTINLSVMGESITYVDKYALANLDKDTRNQMEYLNSLNEVVGYNLESIKVLLSFILLVLIWGFTYKMLEDK
jgi:quinol-cytochrome oxidoreductase complex cytochrome b subunit